VRKLLNIVVEIGLILLSLAKRIAKAKEQIKNNRKIRSFKKINVRVEYEKIYILKLISQYYKLNLDESSFISLFQKKFIPITKN
jgi:hypothetical protein